MSELENYLKKIDDVIARGPYKDDWASLSKIDEPQWYKDAKFGIFIHWGVYAAIAFGSEWYARNMYRKGTKEYDHHIEKYGAHKDFGYADFVPMFKAEKFDPKAWATLFKEAGARFVMPVAEHHDGFQMYDSQLSDWNAVKMGPKRDILGDLKTAIEAEGMIFSASSHRAENVWFMCEGRMFDSGIQDIDYQEPYGFALKLNDKNDDKPPRATGEYGEGAVPVAHLEDWLARTCEIVDKYQPKIVWFDWWIQNAAFKPYLKKFAAYYYNRGVEWGEEVAINYKNDAYVKGTAIFDVERGQLSDINPRFWQTDTAIAKNSWCYTEKNDFKSAESILCDLMDIVSKNGCMLLNVGPKADGTITEEETNILKNIGAWLKDNGEAVYNSTYWAVFGEGPTEIVVGSHMEGKRVDYTYEDIRFTYKAPYIYATVLKWNNDTVNIKALADKSKYFEGTIKNVELLAYNHSVEYTQDKEALKITVDGEIETIYPVCFKIEID